MNMCQSSPCQNNGSCANLPGEYMCNCTAGYTGNDCADVDYCLNATCHTGVCIVRTYTLQLAVLNLYLLINMWQYSQSMEQNFSCLCANNSIGVTCPQGLVVTMAIESKLTCPVICLHRKCHETIPVQRWFIWIQCWRCGRGSGHLYGDTPICLHCCSLES